MILLVSAGDGRLVPVEIKRGTADRDTMLNVAFAAKHALVKSSGKGRPEFVPDEPEDDMPNFSFWARS
jgi:hypothetical protein